MKLIVGLGNPGEKYSHTRHNIGFRVLDSIVNELSGNWTLMTKCSALIHKVGDSIYAKPQTFMNLSGSSVAALLHYYKIDFTDCVIVYDDKDMKFGTMRERATGSSGGHNGMNSIIGVLGTKDIARLKIGVAPADDDVEMYDTADYVLGKFTKEEEKALPEIIAEAVKKLQQNKNA